MWDKIKMTIARLMYGRNGADELGLFSLIAAMLINLINNFIGSSLLVLVSFALYIWTIFRIFSRNLEKRSAENEKYRALFEKVRKELRQFFLRLKNSREYKYFRCPGCKARMRLKRGTGDKHIICPKCHTEFDKKA